MTEPHYLQWKMSTPSPQPEHVTYHFDKEDTVTLIIGPEKRELLTHGNFIARKSEFFQVALKREWKEGQARTITMPEDDYETMTRYLSFVYSEKLPTTHLNPSVPSHLILPSQSSVADLYVLGTRMLDMSMKKAALEEVVRLSEIICPWSRTVNIIYSGTCEGDPARRLMVDLYAKKARGHWLSLGYNQTFLLELAQRLLVLNGPNIHAMPILAADYFE
jgi:hypothetical protein